MTDDIFGFLMQNMNTIAIMAAIAGVAIGGILVRRRWIRIILWVLSLPSLGIGILALIQGGIAEPFTPAYMTVFCASTFAPIVGCVTGEVIIFITKKRETQPRAAGYSVSHGGSPQP